MFWCMLSTTSAEKSSRIRVPCVPKTDGIFFNDCSMNEYLSFFLLGQLLSAFPQNAVLFVSFVRVDLDLCFHVLGTLSQPSVSLSEILDSRILVLLEEAKWTE
jgi:hypothetical protein